MQLWGLPQVIEETMTETQQHCRLLVSICQDIFHILALRTAPGGLADQAWPLIQERSSDGSGPWLEMESTFRRILAPISSSTLQPSKDSQHVAVRPLTTIIQQV